MKQGTRTVLPGPYEVTTATYEVAAPGPGQALIETEASAISPGTELAIYTGIHQWLADPKRTWPKFPFTPGYSAVGRVAAVGQGVEPFPLPHPVISAPPHPTHP